jgi:DNA-binding winged helix-turn-helix (wHTH) protein
MQPAPVVRFGPFEVDLVAAELRKRGRKVPLQDQPFKVLGLLLQRPGELVTREELQRALWPGDTFGEFDEGLNKAIQKLRQALDDSTDSAKFIETLPRKGYRFIAALESPTEQPATPPEPVQEVQAIQARRSGREILAWALVAILTLAFLVAVVMRQQPGEIRAVRFQVSPPEKVTQDYEDIPVVSPDGRYVVFGGMDQNAKYQLWVHSLDSLATQRLPDTESKNGNVFPFWSPDSRSVGFFQGNKLKKIDITGGQAVVLCDAPFPVYGGAWSQDGTILFAPIGGLRRVSAAGGDATLALGLDKSRKEVGQVWPYFLPDGRHYLYLSLVRDHTKAAIYVASLDSTETRRLLSSESNVAYAPPGFLIYARADVLMAQAFDAGGLRLKGDPFPTTESADG